MPASHDTNDNGNATHTQADLIPHRRSQPIANVFAWYTRRLFNHRFNRVLADTASLNAIERTWAQPGPLILLGNHQSWWDPLVAVLMNHRLNRFGRGRNAKPRGMLALMDAAELRRFAIFRRLGVFGVDPDEPASLDVMADYLEHEYTRDPEQTFWITPQGHFTDVRVPMRLRPGAAAVAARLGSRDHPTVRVACIHMDYVFWNESKPELLIRFDHAHRPDRSTTTAWMRTMTEAMERNRVATAELALARDPAPFTTVVGRNAAGATGIYGLWLKLRGQTGELGAERAQHTATQGNAA